MLNQRGMFAWIQRSWGLQNWASLYRLYKSMHPASYCWVSGKTEHGQDVDTNSDAST